MGEQRALLFRKDPALQRQTKDRRRERSKNGATQEKDRARDRERGKGDFLFLFFCSFTTQGLTEGGMEEGANKSTYAVEGDGGMSVHCACVCLRFSASLYVCEYVHVCMRISLARAHTLLKCPCDINYTRIMAYTCIHVCL